MSSDSRTDALAAFGNRALPRMKRVEYEQRIADYLRVLRERERSSMMLLVPLVAALIGIPLVLTGLVPRRFLVLSIIVPVGLLTPLAVWIAVRAKRERRMEDVIAPCPACGIELAWEYNEVIHGGLCPRCGERAISDAV
jgi:predicted RNA-binding Zn-ribbon protein involved in translation (DUF1610 family)